MAWDNTITYKASKATSQRIALMCSAELCVNISILHELAGGSKIAQGLLPSRSFQSYHH